MARLHKEFVATWSFLWAVLLGLLASLSPTSPDTSEACAVVIPADLAWSRCCGVSLHVSDCAGWASAVLGCDDGHIPKWHVCMRLQAQTCTDVAQQQAAGMTPSLVLVQLLASRTSVPSSQLAGATPAAVTCGPLFTRAAALFLGSALSLPVLLGGSYSVRHAAYHKYTCCSGCMGAMCLQPLPTRTNDLRGICCTAVRLCCALCCAVCCAVCCALSAYAVVCAC